MLVLIRVIIGLIFIVSGAEKLFSPYQNFLYALQAYQALPPLVEKGVAILFPWVEVIIGLFTVLGLWTLWALRGALVCFAVFVLMVGQALLRGIALDQCGCFGQLLHISPRVIIVFDSCMLLVTYVLLRVPSKIQKWSLDQYFSK